MIDIPVIETPRLVLRAHRQDDFDGYAAMMADAVVMRFLGGAPLAREDAWMRMARAAGQWVIRGFGPLAIEEKATGRFAGQAGPLAPEGWPGVEIGWTLARTFWGKGYASEAAGAAMDWIFAREPGLARVISLIDPANAASIRVAERLGETNTGERFAYHGGGSADIYAVTRAERARFKGD